MNKVVKIPAASIAELDSDLNALNAGKDRWAQTTVSERIAVLEQIKETLMSVAEEWALTAAKNKQIAEGSHLVGEEWISGPYAVMSACNGLMGTLSKMDNKSFAKHLPKRVLSTGQTAVKVTPHTIWDHLLISGVKAEVWMQPHINRDNLGDHVATAYDTPENQRKGKVALVLGAGNIAAIPPLDAFQKLFLENQVVLLKMNPVNDYLTPFLRAAFKPLIDMDALRIVKGDGSVGAYLTDHDIINEIHITGAGLTHDAIVWGVGKEGEKNKAAGTPKNSRNITSELGAVCPTIVVPGPWSSADIRFQAEQIATQKLHNSGFNCVACQTLIMPNGWEKGAKLLARIEATMTKFGQRGAYYPGAKDRMSEFSGNAGQSRQVPRGTAPAVEITEFTDNNSEWLGKTEVFAPALATKSIPAADAKSYLKDAIAFANDGLYGTLGANIVIHPRTIRDIGKKEFEQIIAELKYGTIAINAWTGLAFLVTTCPWGGYPNATLDAVGSGIGTVHNTFMLEGVERTVISAPWRPFPRGVLSGQFTLLPRPPWFISNRQQHHVGKLLTRFQYRPSWFKLPRIFFHALLG